MLMLIQTISFAFSRKINFSFQPLIPFPMTKGTLCKDSKASPIMASLGISAALGLPNTCVQGVAEFRNVIFTKFVLLIYTKSVLECGDEMRSG
jgi:hypothetical protein